MAMTAANASSCAVAANDDRVVNLRLDAGVAGDGVPALQSAVEIRVPMNIVRPAIALVCLPGGGMNRRFFDLVDGDDTSFSFARAMTARGFIVVMIDHLGIGASDHPADAEMLTPDLLVSANAKVVAQVLDSLRDGSLVAGEPALPELQSIGVGHSMGAMLTVLQQAQYQQHAALGVLGFSTRGLPEYLSPELRELARDRVAVRAQLVELARAMFARPPASTPRSATQGGDFFASGKADPRGVKALRPAVDKILPIPAFLSMLPGNIADASAQIRVPVFLGLGELDIVGPTHEVPAAFGNSHDVTLHIMPQAGHSHFIFAARSGLFQRFAQWARLLANDS
ncbi:MAG: alpha/beta hydrolase [Nevskia sp.]|nr:alpha/beta hydrolase [Nevskia sp.]